MAERELARKPPLAVVDLDLENDDSDLPESRSAPDSVRRLAARLKRARTRRGWSLRHLGEVAGLSYEAVRRIETGLVDPRWSVVVRLAQILGLSSRELQQVIGDKQAHQRGRI
jgi:ribosome-binding protein aMBF1 (putative translation factor)